MKKRFLLALTLIADALLFFARPLFSTQYSFPWDFRMVQIPLITFLADQLKRHDLPLWDPYTYCGNPIYANIQACFFHPLVFLAAALSSVTGPGTLRILVEWTVVLQVCIAGLFSYKLARHIGCTAAGAWTAAVISQTGPYFASRAEHMGAMMAAAWLPAAWYAVLRLRSNTSPRTLALLGAALGMSILGGSPAATTAVFGSTLLLAILLRRGLITTLGCALGIGLSAIVFIPAAELTQNSVAKYRLDWLGTGGGLKWSSLMSLLIPNYSQIFDLANFKGPGDPTFLYLYCSLTGLVFAILVVILRRDRWVKCFALIALLGGLFMMGDSIPLWRTLYPLLPERIRIGIHPEFTYCVFGECVALLAGMGISRLIRISRLQWAFAAVVAVELYVAGSNRPMNTASLRQEPDFTTPQQIRTLSSLETPPARVDTTSGVSIAWQEAAPLTRVPTGNGASPFALERIIQIRLGLHPGGRAGWNYPVQNFASSMLDLMSERYLLASATAASQLDANPRFRQIAPMLFENTSALPRAFVVGSFTQSPFPEAARKIQAPGFDVHREATIEPPALPSTPNKTETHGTATFTIYSPNKLAVTATSDSPSLLVLTESWYPGWEARLDGKATPIYIADAAFRGVLLPPGTHQLTMDFHPRILLYSAAISVISLAILAILYKFPFRVVKQSKIA